MILETKQEQDAFEFVCKLADELTDRRGCNDLPKEDVEKFKDLQVESSDTDGIKFLRQANMDFDIIHWLKKQVKK